MFEKLKKWYNMTKEEKTKWVLEKGIDILSEVLQPPFQVIRKLVGNEYDFVIGKFPKEIVTNEEPPIQLDERAEIIPIERYLGLYEPTKIKITIFNKGIKNASNIIKCNVEHLKYIVRLHEWSHALVHIGFSENEIFELSENDKLWNKKVTEATKIYTSIEDKLHERIAQLLTYHSILLIMKNVKYEKSKKILKKILNVFLELNKRQPPEYRINNYLSIPKKRIIQSIYLLKKGWLKVFNAWDIAIKW